MTCTRSGMVATFTLVIDWSLPPSLTVNSAGAKSVIGDPSFASTDAKTVRVTPVRDCAAADAVKIGLANTAAKIANATTGTVGLLAMPQANMVHHARCRHWWVGTHRLVSGAEARRSRI